MNIFLIHCSQRKPETKTSLGDKTQKNTRIFLRPKKIRDRSLDPKKYRACKFSTQKYTSDPPVMYTSSTPPGRFPANCLLYGLDIFVAAAVIKGITCFVQCYNNKSNHRGGISLHQSLASGPAMEIWIIFVITHSANWQVLKPGTPERRNT